MDSHCFVLLLSSTAHLEEKPDALCNGEALASLSLGPLPQQSRTVTVWGQLEWRIRDIQGSQSVEEGRGRREEDGFRNCLPG